MAADKPTAVPHPLSAEDLDDVFEALAHRYRRTIIRELEWGEPRDLDDLVALVADEDESSTAIDARVALVHNHLPHLAESSVIAYDTEEQVAELDDADAERAVLSAVHEAE